MKPLFSLLLLLSTVIIGYSQGLMSPQNYLGYKVGTRFTRHDKIVSYFKAVAAAKPSMVKLEKYGETNEGRELLVAYISTPENIAQLEAIRSNNLRLAGLLKDKIDPATSHAPAIVWLSYNVHGNEPASSEAALLTLYSLVDTTNKITKKWLKNTVVIIDPCLNPDGRDRYVNWFNSVAGVGVNTNAQSREHSEPWPQGRTNHYNFDLNKDWAWQTQTETKARLKLYNQWMPQIHVDYHEQSDGPYYFAPAAEPFHEMITQWQRDFQTTIGKNHAQYFDANGWLYFTKERYDLFYPSYGDTYPIFNGAIGMTYEQGGIGAGLGLKTDNGDTLTLQDRVEHHCVTALSTIEVASKNAAQLISQYKRFYDENASGKKFVYKTYIISADVEDKLTAALQLLKANSIEYGELVGSAPFKGYNYLTQKEETGSLKKYYAAISVLQPRSTLATVLLEPRTRIVDSNTYDITAWSIPYAYGLEAYALKEALPVTVKAGSSLLKARVLPQSNYGYLIKYNSFAGAKVLATLLSSGVKVRFANKPFVYSNETFDRGTLVVLVKGNPQELNQLISNAIANSSVGVTAVASGFMDKGVDFGSPDIRMVNAPRVALLTGEQTGVNAAGEVWNFFDQVIHYPVTLFNTNDLAKINLKDFSVLILPDGSYKTLNDKAILDKLKDFVQSGGKIIAIQNAVQKLAAADWGIKTKEDAGSTADDKDKKEDYSKLKKFADRERTELSNSIPGAIYKLDIDNTHPLAYGYPDYYYSLKQDDNIYQFLKDGWNVGTIKKEAYITGFSGTKVKAKLKDGLVFGVQEMGNGNVVYLSDDPLFRLFWENGKLLFSNAVFLIGQ